jgi:dihydroorotase
MHPEIRSRKACYLSSSMAVDLAKKYGTKLHVLHISTADEIALFDAKIPLAQKRITAEACIHHLWFERSDYKRKGALIKWNPAVKESSDREAIFSAVLNGNIDVIATDHAPHTLKEKQGNYFEAPSGGPLVQHSLVAAMEFVGMGKISIEKVVEKMCHNPAILFQIKDRGFIREGYYADLVIVDPQRPWNVEKSNILYKCGWSPFEGQQFNAQVTHTIVSGHLAYELGNFDESKKGERLAFDR